MTKQAKNPDQWEAVQQEIANIDSMMSLKRTDIKEIETQIAQEEGRYYELTERLANAQRDIALRRLSTEDYLELRKNKEDLEQRLKVLRETRQMQQEGLKILGYEKTNLAKGGAIALKRIAAKQAETDLDALIGAAAPLLTEWISKVITKNALQFDGWNLAQKNEQMERLYQAVGTDLFKKLQRPTAIQARQAVIAAIRKNQPELEDAA
ncbi:hypothetical protein [Methylotuvimicrobium alcaliphilum]|uniref:Uncharacterized protein n=1 Tax=Methylotuvimicrobium alcaliphilum (strain DSM 19304 / NCIMB 14124 / VKM B-2133 / 20Z) TaxID=1091494 RepID=G4T1E7_META2|nr:hypothetical protein [Methylotuvimicrobium alcaliphilum]CCE25696.1 protein of unknown function [Methylotuvimicrobium alcaliphilum 20Z]